jgi:hypothetical protein
VSFDPQLWVAMAAAALFYHYATSQKASTQLYLFASVVVSAICMLVLKVDWIGLTAAQVVLFIVLRLAKKKQ